MFPDLRTSGEGVQARVRPHAADGGQGPSVRPPRFPEPATLQADSLDTEGSALAPQCWHKAPERVSLG